MYRRVYNVAGALVAFWLGQERCIFVLRIWGTHLSWGHLSIYSRCVARVIPSSQQLHVSTTWVHLCIVVACNTSYILEPISKADIPTEHVTVIESEEKKNNGNLWRKLSAKEIRINVNKLRRFWRFIFWIPGFVMKSSWLVVCAHFNIGKTSVHFSLIWLGGSLF